MNGRPMIWAIPRYETRFVELRRLNDERNQLGSIHSKFLFKVLVTCTPAKASAVWALCEIKERIASSQIFELHHLPNQPASEPV